MPSLGRQVKCAQSPKTSTGSGFYSFPGRPTMSTFPAPRTLTERIQGAHLNLKLARQAGNPDIIAAAERILNQLVDRLPRSTSQE
ncbi:hypothetical protein PBI_MOZY_100 [Mycobacterium phage Mozy]|uniref:Uncharacterized protein n=17 Tax=Cheoctovirus TaxID=1623281 RepID=G1D4L4_9CAUD|nr:hypothetical protein FGG28_gp100 [Mycobacterium phage Mozy]AEK09714.1 hypothetical protein PBI_MOZY_100 [Mycobacterium phage Mozy]